MQKLTIIFGFFILFTINCIGQFSINSTSVSPEEEIRKSLIGEGVEIISISYDGGEKSIGAFSGGKNTNGHPEGLGVESGLVISNGAVLSIESKGVGNGTDSQDMNYEVGNGTNAANHPNLKQLVGSDGEIKDLVVIKIEFIPETDTFRLNYVWASEEYPNYVCSQFNDKFGFILSGPGIVGDYNGGNGKNIALIPGTNLPVAINNLNNGIPVGGPASNCAQEAINGETKKYFINNIGFGPNARPAFNGYSTVLEAKSSVIPCEVYTIELMLADISDGLQDSGVFFEKGSFRTSKMSVLVNTPNDDNTIVEGCASSVIELIANNKFSESISLNAEIKGSAKIEEDYKLKLNGNAITSESEIVLAANAPQLNIEIEAINDNIQEGTEEVIIKFRKSLFLNPLAVCEDMDSVVIYIKDNNLIVNELPDTVNICNVGSKELDGSVLTPVLPANKFDNSSTLEIKPEKVDIISTILVSGEEQSSIGPNSLPEICFDISHKNPKDLIVHVISPNGKVLELVTNVGKDFEADYTQTCFSATASTLISNGVSPYNGTFLPEGDFNSLIGANVNGEWQLKIIDTEQGVTGELNSWSIKFTNPYSFDYLWSPDMNISNTNTGVVIVNPTESTLYNLKVKDIYSCVVEDSTFVRVNGEYPLSVDTSNIKCFGEKTGRISLTSSDNTVKYTWEDGPVGGERTNLQAGEYIVTLEGDSGCEQKETFFINQPEELIYSAVIKDESCNESSDGEINIVVDGGNPPYSISWGNSSSELFDIINLKKGKYIATITDANGCSLLVDEEVNESAPYMIDTLLTNISCNGLNNGKIEVSISENTNPVTFLWTGPNSYSNTKSTISNLSPGNYNVLIQEEGGCKTIIDFIVNEPEQIELSYEYQDVKCFGELSGEIKLSAKGGTQPFNFSIDNGLSFKSDSTYSSLKAGMYSVIVEDSKGCKNSEIQTIEILEPSEVRILLDSIYDIVFGESVEVSAEPSISENEISNISWNPTDNLTCDDCLKLVCSPEKTTTYTLSITDANGCVTNKSILIRVDRSPRVEIANIFTPNGDNINDEVFLVTDNIIVQKINNFRVFDRWGSLIFQKENLDPNSEELKWDGKCNGKFVETGTYVWFAEIMLLDDVKKIYQGTITLIK